MIKNTFKIDYQLKRDEQGRQMLFVSSYQNNIKIEEHFAGYIDDILSKNKKQKEAIDKANEWIKKKINSCTIEAESTTKDTICKITISGLYNLLNILKEVE